MDIKRPARRLIKDADILLCNDNGEYFLKRKSILVNNRMIEDIYEAGSKSQNLENLECKEIDFNGKTVIPAFFNLHTHLGEAEFEGISGSDWTILRYLNYTETLNRGLRQEEKDKRWKDSAEITLERLLDTGIIGFAAGRSAEICSRKNIPNMSGYPLMKSTKLRNNTDLGIKGFLDYYNTYRKTDCRVGVLLHSLYYTDIREIEIASKAMASGADFFAIHISEDEETRNLEMSKYGEEPIKLLDQYGLIGGNSLLVHCGYISAREMEIIADRGAVVVICPGSNMFLNTKLPNVCTIDKMGISWAVATDGLATGRSLSLTKQLTLLKKKFKDLSPYRLLDSITKIPSGVFDYTGKIEEGKLAAFNVIDGTFNDVDSLVEAITNDRLEYGLYRFL